MVPKGEGAVWPRVSWRWAIMAVAVVASAHDEAYRAAPHCDAARAMGLAPVRRDQPGYRSAD